MRVQGRINMTRREIVVEHATTSLPSRIVDIETTIRTLWPFEVLEVPKFFKLVYAPLAHIQHDVAAQNVASPPPPPANAVERRPLVYVSIVGSDEAASVTNTTLESALAFFGTCVDPLNKVRALIATMLPRSSTVRVTNRYTILAPFAIHWSKDGIGALLATCIAQYCCYFLSTLAPEPQSALARNLYDQQHSHHQEHQQQQQPDTSFVRANALLGFILLISMALFGRSRQQQQEQEQQQEPQQQQQQADEEQDEQVIANIIYQADQESGEEIEEGGGDAEGVAEEDAVEDDDIQRLGDAIDGESLDSDKSESSSNASSSSSSANGNDDILDGETCDIATVTIPVVNSAQEPDTPIVLRLPYQLVPFCIVQAYTNEHLQRVMISFTKSSAAMAFSTLLVITAVAAITSTVTRFLFSPFVVLLQLLLDVVAPTLLPANNDATFWVCRDLVCTLLLTATWYARNQGRIATIDAWLLATGFLKIYCKLVAFAPLCDLVFNYYNWSITNTVHFYSFISILYTAFQMI